MKKLKPYRVIAYVMAKDENDAIEKALANNNDNPFVAKLDKKEWAKMKGKRYGKK